MANTTNIIGYVVKNSNGWFVDFDPETGTNFFVEERPKPISKPDAYRRLAAFLDQTADGVLAGGEPYVTPVFRERTPVERASAELAVQLKSLCARHGLDLGLSDEQIEARIGEELQAFKAGDKGVL